MQLFVGSEVLNASDTDITSNHQHLYIRHKDLIQACHSPSRQPRMACLHAPTLSGHMQTMYQMQSHVVGPMQHA